MDYQIIEETFSNGSVTKYKVIGNGFQSVNAVWMAVQNEIARRIHDPPFTVSLRIDALMNDQTTIVIGVVRLAMEEFK
jgi:hypothetical protein